MNARPGAVGKLPHESLAAGKQAGVPGRLELGGRRYGCLVRRAGAIVTRVT
jgi:hypothetical protein